VKEARIDNRPDHKPMFAAGLGEIDLRSMIRAITKSIRNTRNGALILRLRKEQEELLTELTRVCELKRQRLEAKLAEIEATKGPETSS
jgi:hypothetical protein